MLRVAIFAIIHQHWQNESILTFSTQRPRANSNSTVRVIYWMWNANDDLEEITFELSLHIDLLSHLSPIGWQNLIKIQLPLQLRCWVWSLMFSFMRSVDRICAGICFEVKNCHLIAGQSNLKPISTPKSGTPSTITAFEMPIADSDRDITWSPERSYQYFHCLSIANDQTRSACFQHLRN